MSGMEHNFPNQNAPMTPSAILLKICMPATMRSSLNDKRFPNQQLSRHVSAAQEPVVENALRAPASRSCFQNLCLRHERFRLAAFDALAKKIMLSRLQRQLCLRDARRQSGGNAPGRARLLHPSDAVRDFASDGAGRDQPAATAFAFHAPVKRLFQLPEFGARRLQRRTALFFLNLENLQQAPHGARNSHGLNLRGQGGKTAQTFSKADALASRLGEKGADRVAGTQGAVEIRIGARLVSTDAHQIL